MLPKVRVENIGKALSILATYNSDTTDGNGITRTALSDADMAAREYIMSYMESVGLTVTTDSVGNIFGTLPGSDPSLAPVWSGSHIDTVIHGGMFDGMAGVVSAIEACRVIAESEAVHKRSIVACVYTSEEPTRFGVGCIGSRALAGKLKLKDAREIFDDKGESLADILQTRGYDALKLDEIEKKKGDIFAALELHIEQAPILEQSGIPVGIVEGICAPTYIKITFSGVQSHAGSTPMHSRKDALCAASEIILKVEELAREFNRNGNDSTVGTVGKISVIPNASNVISGKATFIIDIRDVDGESKNRFTNQIVAYLQTVSNRRDVSLEYQILENDPPCRCDGRLMMILEESCKKIGVLYNKMLSGAYHDSLLLSEITPVAMIFVPSKNGISHDPAEYTRNEEITQGADILAEALLRVSNEQ